MIEVISAEKFKNEIFDYTQKDTWAYDQETPVIVNFFATWCGPCHRFAPVLEKISEEYQGRVKVYKIDIDATPEVPALFGVRSVPTTLFIAKNEDPGLAQGAMPEESMKQAMKELLNIE